MKTVLIFEPLSGGHRANYIRWLAESIANNPPPGFHFIFVVGPDAGIPSAFPLSSHRISPELAQELAGSGPAKQGRLLRTLFDECVTEHSPDHVLVLELTRLELSFALFGLPCPVSAILFVQYPEIPRGPKFLFKDWKTALLLHRTPVRNLFLLNGEESCRYLTRRFSIRTRFIPVPDPAPVIESEPGFMVREFYGIAPDRTVFLFFGAASVRKGADVLIEALHLLPPGTAAQSAFIFCGEPEHGYRQTFEKACLYLRRMRSDVNLSIDACFVSDQRMMALFEQSDVVLMPYRRSEYSSGILALAAQARTPVIGPDSGLLGRLIRQHGLGRTCRISPEYLAKSIAAAVSPPGVDEVRCSAFVQQSRPEKFARTILDAVCYES